MSGDGVICITPLRLSWARGWLEQVSPEPASRVPQYGSNRMIHDFVHRSGTLPMNAQKRLQGITLSTASWLTKLLLVPLLHLLASHFFDATLDEN